MPFLVCFFFSQCHGWYVSMYVWMRSNAGNGGCGCGCGWLFTLHMLPWMWCLLVPMIVYDNSVFSLSFFSLPCLSGLYYTYDCTLSCPAFHSTVLLSLTRGPLVVIMITERNIVSSFLLSPLVPKYPPLARIFSCISRPSVFLSSLFTSLFFLFIPFTRSC